jgi:poly-gamma-glutamate capsule biosynthesis protein CapA/YwtB (metallophosphatase superfamily)
VDAVGDMIFDRKIAALIATAGGEAPLAGVATVLAAADFTFGNLEGPLSSGGTQATSKDYTLRGDPRGVEGLKSAGFDAVALGNNHSLDYGVSGLMDTIATLDQAGIAHTGAGADRQAAAQIVYLRRSGTTVAFLSFSDVVPASFIAGPDHPGVAQGRGNMDHVTRAIAQAKKHADHVVVAFHWGVQYSESFSDLQKTEARSAIDAGADIVLGHHPHVIQGVEIYKHKLIAYSLGDFVFDHSSRRTGEAFILEAELGPAGLGTIRAVPVYLDGSGAPRIVHGSEASTILVRLKLLSPANTIVHVSGDTATVTAR